MHLHKIFLEKSPNSKNVLTQAEVQNIEIRLTDPTRNKIFCTKTP